jgi:hypothetical protein
LLVQTSLVVAFQSEESQTEYQKHLKNWNRGVRNGETISF